MVHMPFEKAGDPKKFRVKVGISLALSLFLLSDKEEEEEEEEVEEEEELCDEVFLCFVWREEKSMQVFALLSSTSLLNF